MNTFERQGARPILDPSESRLGTELRRLKSYGKSSYASLTREDGSYVQVAGGGVTCLVERRDAKTGRHFRAFTSQPSVSFDDGTLLEFGGGRMALRSDEWFGIDAVHAIFTAFLAEQSFPATVGWRDVTESLSAP